MRRPTVVSLASLTLVLLTAAMQHAVAHESIGFAVPQTKEELEAARYQLKLFERVEFPLRLRAINNDIRSLQARIDFLRERIRDYERFPRSPFLVTLQNARLQLLDSELDLRLRRQERAKYLIDARDESRRRKQAIQAGEEHIAANEPQEAGG